MKCRWCDFEITPVYAGKDGKKRSGWMKLRWHIEDEHPDEAETLRTPYDGVEPEDDDDDAG